MSKTEKNYSAHKLEFLALKWAVTERFHEYLYGGNFEVYTDNNPLRMPHLPNAATAAKELIIQTDYQLSKSQWRDEQATDASIAIVLELIQLG